MMMALMAGEAVAAQDAKKQTTDAPAVKKVQNTEKEKLPPLSVADIYRYAKELDGNFRMREKASQTLLQQCDERVVALLPHAVASLSAEAKSRAHAIIKPHVRAQLPSDADEEGWAKHWFWMHDEQAKKDFVSGMDPTQSGKEVYEATRRRYMDEARKMIHEQQPAEWNHDYGDERLGLALYSHDVKQRLMDRKLHWTPQHQEKLETLQKEDPKAAVADLVLKIRAEEPPLTEEYLGFVQPFETESNKWRKGAGRQPHYWKKEKEEKKEKKDARPKEQSRELRFPDAGTTIAALKDRHSQFALRVFHQKKGGA